MHPAWYIDDIQKLIFEYLERRDLAQLARTATFFFDISTDELWKTITSFKVLVPCLPPDSRDRPLQSEDVERLDHYISKVRHLQLEADRDSAAIQLPPGFSTPKKSFWEQPSKKSWQELWGEIAEVRPPSELFRNLQSLRVNNVIEELLMPLIGISGLHLTKIYIKFFQEKQEDSVIRRIMDGFQDTPNLEYIFVRDGESGYIPRKLIQQASLKHLRLDRPKPSGYFLPNRREETSILRDVLQKPTIEHLTIGLTNDWYTPEIQALEGKHLPALKTLWLNLTDFTTEWRCRSCTDSGAPSWDCDCVGVSHFRTMGNPAQRSRRSPIAFFGELDNPELDVLNIVFPQATSGKMLSGLTFAAHNSCRLRNLTELAWAGGEGNDYSGVPCPRVNPAELRMAIKMLLPLPRLRVLRISVAPNFLDNLDLELYRSIAEGLPALETLWLGHATFATFFRPSNRKYYEDVPLSHLAAFCQMLPNLIEVSVGAAIPEPYRTLPRPEFSCPQVDSVRILHWSQRIQLVQPQQLLSSLQMYFPNSKQAKNGLWA